MEPESRLTRVIRRAEGNPQGRTRTSEPARMSLSRVRRLKSAIYDRESAASCASPWYWL